MKKRLLVVISILMISAVLTACGGGTKPDGMTQEVYEIGCNALEIMEKYNNAEIDKENAESRISALYTKISNVPELSDVIENANKGFVESSIFLFKMSLDSNDGGTYDQEKSLRELLKK